MKIHVHPSPNFNQRPETSSINHLVLHYTACDFQRALDYLVHSQPPNRVSAHYLVNTDGAIYQLVPEAMRAWHAGSTSQWGKVVDLNNTSIGIEIVNLGHGEGGTDPYTVPQLQSVLTLCQDIIRRHGISPWNVVGHSDIRPKDKQDPGEHFPWAWFSERGVGLWPHAMEGDPKSDAEPVYPHILSYQRDLLSYGYACPLTGIHDEPTAMVIKAYQRHFCPHRVDGIPHAWDYQRLKELLSLKHQGFKGPCHHGGK